MNLDVVASVNVPPLTRFAIALFLVLVIPSTTQRLRIPSCVGFLVAGVLIGPHGLSIIPQHAEVANFFGELGKLLLMFFVGLEIDLKQFNVSRLRSLAFGLLTFALPFVAGTAIGLTFGYRPVASILIGSLLASHTLIGYPIVQAHKAVARPAVIVTVGATILTDILSLLLLTICVATFKSGFTISGTVIQIAEVGAFVLLVGIGFGIAGRWLLDRFGKSEEACCVLLMVIVSVSAALAEFIHLEGILGAFLAGLAVNAAVRDSTAKDKLEFLGNVLFIPAFFMVTGFLIDPRLFLATLVANLPLVLAITTGLIGAKWLAAEIAGRVWSWSVIDRGLMASLTIPQVAAAIAAALVGYQALNAAGERLLDGAVLNTVLVLVVVTALTGPILTQIFLRRLPISEESQSAGSKSEGEMSVLAGTKTVTLGGRERSGD